MKKRRNRSGCSSANDRNPPTLLLVGHSISGVIAALYAAAYPVSGLIEVDQELDSSFVRLLQANREALTGAGFAGLWPGILTSMRLDVPPTTSRLLSTESPRQDVALAYWRQGLETALPELDAGIAEVTGLLRRKATPVLIVAGHACDAGYSLWLRREVPQARVTVMPDSGHFPHLAHPEAFAALLRDTGRWRRPEAPAR